MEASSETKLETQVPANKGRSRWGRFITPSILIAVILIASILYITVASYSPYPRLPPYVYLSNSSNTTDWIFTVTEIPYSHTPILKSKVYVQLHNQSGYVIYNEQLTAASGSHGFNYLPNSSGDYVTVGDVLTISKEYAQGGLSLVTEHGEWTYASKGFS
jgi:hypothetical protein